MLLLKRIQSAVTDYNIKVMTHGAGALIKQSGMGKGGLLWHVL